MHFSSRQKKQLLFVFCFFPFVFELSAQQIHDSIPIGIISVKRPPIPASYKFHLEYFDSDLLQSQSHITEFSAKQIVFGDSGIVFRPPQPFLSDKNFSDTIFKRDITSQEFYAIDTTDNYYFAWEKYAKFISWKFEWKDSTRLDSAQFEFTIDKKGNAKCKSLPWTKADSTCRAFEKKSFPYLFLLSQWYPAKRNKPGLFRRKRKFRNIPCVVLVTIYAYDPNAGKLLPIKIIRE